MMLFALLGCIPCLQCSDLNPHQYIHRGLPDQILQRFHRQISLIYPKIGQIQYQNCQPIPQQYSIIVFQTQVKGQKPMMKFNIIKLLAGLLFAVMFLQAVVENLFAKS